MSVKPRISYIVSAYKETLYLPCCLWSLRVQTDQSFEVIVTDNSGQKDIHDVAKSIFPDATYIATNMNTCFESAAVGVEAAVGEFICFPSHDSYYVPVFGETMYRAAVDNSVDFVMCDIVYDPRSGQGRYSVVPQHPFCGWFDKTGFILRRDKFQPFPNAGMIFPPRTSPVLESGDGLLAEKLVREGVRYVELRDVLAVHN